VGILLLMVQEKTVLGTRTCLPKIKYIATIFQKIIQNIYGKLKLNPFPISNVLVRNKLPMYVSSKNNGFGHSIYLQIPRIKNPIPLFIAFRAIGATTDLDICNYILLNVNENTKITCDHLQASIIEANEIRTKEQAINYINQYVMYTPMNMDKELGAQKKLEFTKDVLENDLFPHCYNTQQKTYFLGYMTHRILECFAGVKPQDDRDSYINKRIDLTGSLLNNLFRNYFNKVVKDMSKQIIKEINTGSWRSTYDYGNIVNHTNIYKIIKSSTIENGIKRALSTGDFGIKQSSSTKVGVAQVLNRLTYASSLSHSRRIATPIDKSGKLIPPRMLHNTTWGFLCPAETPEGQSVGVVKNLSYMTHVTIPSNSSSIITYVGAKIIPIENIQTHEAFNKVKVFVNGAWVGISEEPMKLYNYLKDLKYKGMINIYTSIIFAYDAMEIRVCNDGGRVTRPVLRVKNNRLNLHEEVVEKVKNKELVWEDLLTNMKVDDSIIEYIDPEEQNTTMISMKPSNLHENNTYNYTHCEIHPSTIFGILASCIPFPEHNQSPRNTYQCAMSKQSMGVYVTNYDNRMDKTAYVLNYPMRPLVDTRIMNLIQLNNIPSGSPVIVAIMTHTGYNQEDSILFNKGSVDRGLFQATIYHT
jgi:DNA-directed RNA polymerase II subunit RPB2